MADAATEGSARTGSAPQESAPGAGGPPPAARPDPAGLSDEPPTGGLTAVLGKLREAAAAHDAELADQDGRLQPG
jgi:hypothetical protein